jgi:opacity protein-like surface antigen
MRIRDLAAAASLLAAAPTVTVAQRTGDQARIIFTVSGAYVQGRGLWTVADQPVQDPPFTDNFVLSRSIKANFGAGFSGAYFAGEHVGLTADFFLLGLGYDDSCRILGTPQSGRNVGVCDDIDEQEKSAAAVTLSGGANFRFFSREFISPFARANVGLLFSNQSSVLTQGVTNEGVLLTVFEDEKRTRVSPAFALGAGTTVAISRGYHLRWEVRDNIVGIEAVTGPTSAPRFVPPHERRYKHMFSVLIGVDVVLERNRGRRY